MLNKRGILIAGGITVAVCLYIWPVYSFGKSARYHRHHHHHDYPNHSTTETSHPNSTDARIANATDIIAEFTVVLGIATIALFGVTAWMGWRQAKDTRIIERAYATLSHTNAGLTANTVGERCNFAIEMEVKNYGSTPARVSTVHINALIYDQGEPMPESPEYGTIDPDSEPPATVFLVTDSFVFTPFTGSASATDWLAVTQGLKTLLIFAYVDYRDAFGIHHRGGYARRYDPARGQLVFVGNDGFNYDRLRTASEGTDWG